MTGLSKKFSELGSEAIWKYIDEEIFANRIKFEGVVAYRERMKVEQKNHLIGMMGADEEAGLYDS
jgi:hypothetical protein